MKFLVLVLLLVFYAQSNAFSQRVTEEPWEPEEEHVFTSSPPPSTFDIFFDISNSAISFYQTSLSVKSISRCPFAISCSHFAQQAIRDHGMIGLLLFVDRYFYRENNDAFSLYPKIISSQQIVKLDDSFYLGSK